MLRLGPMHRCVAASLKWRRIFLSMMPRTSSASRVPRELKQLCTSTAYRCQVKRRSQSSRRSTSMRSVGLHLGLAKGSWMRSDAMTNMWSVLAGASAPRYTLYELKRPRSRCRMITWSNSLFVLPSFE